jgi:hypothetical protein
VASERAPFLQGKKPHRTVSDGLPPPVGGRPAAPATRGVHFVTSGPLVTSVIWFRPSRSRYRTRRTQRSTWIKGRHARAPRQPPWSKGESQMKNFVFVMLLSLAVMCGCGTSAKQTSQTSALLTPQSWAGTYSGTVNWTGTSNEQVTLTISTPVTTYVGGSTWQNAVYTSSLNGTDSGGACAANGGIELMSGNGVVTGASQYYSSYDTPAFTSVSESGTSLGTGGSIFSSCPTEIGPYPTTSFVLTLQNNTITIGNDNAPTIPSTGLPPSIGVLTKQ